MIIKLIFIVLSGFSNKYFLRKRGADAKHGERITKNPTLLHEKKKTKPKCKAIISG